VEALFDEASFGGVENVFPPRPLCLGCKLWHEQALA
jgi:hypothetical protein